MTTLFKAILPHGLYEIYNWWKQNHGIPGFKGLDKLDKQIINIIKPRKGGYFIELGANDGVRQSNTYALQYAFDWTGILIEPNPKYYSVCIKNRSFKNRPHVVTAACVQFGYPEKFVEMVEADLMSVALGLKVNDSEALKHAERGALLGRNDYKLCKYGAIARTLHSILEEYEAPSNIDLLSIDVEGNEAAVLKGINFDKFRPLWILIEIRSHDTESHQILIDHHYKLHSTLNPRNQLADYLYKSII